MNYELEKLLPQKHTVSEMIYYNYKASILNKLSNLNWLDNKSYEMFKKEWDSLNKNLQQEVVKEYEASRNHSVFFTLLHNTDYKNMDSKALLLEFLLKNNFNFSYKDTTLFKENNWLAYESLDYGKVYQIHWYSITYTYFTQCYDYFKSKINKLFSVKTNSSLYLIYYYPDKYIPTLITHMDKLPKELKAKLLRELPNEKLENLLQVNTIMI